MSYKPRPETQQVLEAAYHWVMSVPYQVTARWVFYRLLQEAVYDTKAGYKHLLGILSKARKEFYSNWRPWILADDTRAPILMQREGYYTLYLRGYGFRDAAEWHARLKEELNCPLDRWRDQPVYAEIWFEASAMQGQFLHYANENLPLLAFHGDVSIPEKWRTAERLAQRYLELRKPVHIYYFGDLDPKGLLIPESAWNDIFKWTVAIINRKEDRLPHPGDLTFERIGINEDQIGELNIPENPERPGTYQWEGLSFCGARNLMVGYLPLVSGLFHPPPVFLAMI
ncbi:hypothetical protein ES703_109013 [subsurface metagenome]